MKALAQITQGLNKADMLRVASVAIAIALLIVSAKIQIPFWPVPLTMQSAVVLLLPCVMGLRAGMVAIAMYLGLGAAGYPVFAMAATGAGGPLYFMGATGGYLVGFVLAGALVGWIYERSSYKTWLPGLIGLMLLGHAIILAAGGVWLAYGLPMLGFEGAIVAGVAPFLWGSVVKSLLTGLGIAVFAASRTR